MDVLATVREEVERRRLLEPGTTIVVGVSGGVDSLCLLHVLNRLRPAFDWFIHVAHLNHCLRAAEANADMAFVVQQALDWALPCTTRVVDVATVAQQRLSRGSRCAKCDMVSWLKWRNRWMQAQ
jgi:tRNA(Ile)-lysidine synthase TilS/MesJ